MFINVTNAHTRKTYIKSQKHTHTFKQDRRCNYRTLQSVLFFNESVKCI